MANLQAASELRYGKNDTPEFVESLYTYMVFSHPELILDFLRSVKKDYIRRHELKFSDIRDKDSFSSDDFQFVNEYYVVVKQLVAIFEIIEERVPLIDPLVSSYANSNLRYYREMAKRTALVRDTILRAT